jgi:hypothetical protein
MSSSSFVCGAVSAGAGAGFEMSDDTSAGAVVAVSGSPASPNAGADNSPIIANARMTLQTRCMCIFHCQSRVDNRFSRD